MTCPPCPMRYTVPLILTTISPQKKQSIQCISIWVNGHPFIEIQEAEDSLSLLHELFVTNHLWPLVYGILIIHTTCSEWKSMKRVRSDPESSAVSHKAGSDHNHEFSRIARRILNTFLLLFDTKHTFNIGAILITWMYFLRRDTGFVHKGSDPQKLFQRCLNLLVHVPQVTTRVGALQVL